MWCIEKSDGRPHLRLRLRDSRAPCFHLRSRQVEALMARGPALRSDSRHQMSARQVPNDRISTLYRQGVSWTALVLRRN